MKEVAILLLAALTLSGCGNTTTTVQTPTGAVWAAVLTGGSGDDPDPSFNTQFTLNANTLDVTYIQFLTQNSCFPVTGGSASGTTNLTINSTTFAVTGSLTYTVQAGGNTLMLSGTTVTGVEVGTTLTSGLVTGTWTETGSTGCNASGNFTMSQSATT